MAPNMNGPESGAGGTWGYGHPSRQARELAEGQNNARVEPFLTALPLSASQENWRSGSNSSRNMQILAIWRRHLAEGVRGSKWRPTVEAECRSLMFRFDLCVDPAFSPWLRGFALCQVF